MAARHTVPAYSRVSLHRHAVGGDSDDDLEYSASGACRCVVLMQRRSTDNQIVLCGRHAAECLYGIRHEMTAPTAACQHVVPRMATLSPLHHAHTSAAFTYSPPFCNTPRCSLGSFDASERAHPPGAAASPPQGGYDTAAVGGQGKGFRWAADEDVPRDSIALPPLSFAPLLSDVELPTAAGAEVGGAGSRAASTAGDGEPSTSALGTVSHDAFQREVQETLLRGMREGISIDNLVLEINSLKLAEVVCMTRGEHCLQNPNTIACISRHAPFEH